MEVIFVYDHVRYRYGVSTDKDRVRYEWLFATPKGREAKLFVREDHEFDFGKGWIKAS